ncbi:MAG: hypothetical protein VKI83_00850 [Synechococcaceae cyanobacterium]|nr:hypothetical protein [Synechococcaceae cyanobacterium]
MARSRSLPSAVMPALAALALSLPLLPSIGVQAASSSEPASTTPSIGEALRPSTQEQIDLAEHLRRKGVLFYGAFWCVHCFRQKNLFGQQAGNRLPYVECAKDEAGMQRCEAAQIKSYPTWVMGSDRREGVQSIEELKVWTGFSPSATLPPTTAPASPTPASSVPVAPR